MGCSLRTSNHGLLWFLLSLDHTMAKDVGARLREALKMQLAIIHERVEAKKIAKMALAEVRNILAKEEAERLMDQKGKGSGVEAKAWEKVEAFLKEDNTQAGGEAQGGHGKTDMMGKEESRKSSKDLDEGQEKGKMSEAKSEGVKSKGGAKSSKKSSKSSS